VLRLERAIYVSLTVLAVVVYWRSAFIISSYVVIYHAIGFSR
jgi:hypothetical protein